MPRILVVDDEPMVREMMVRALKGYGYDVVALADGVEGLHAATHEMFDLIVTNDCMPRMNGAELVARLRQQCPDLPILHVTSWPHDAEIPPARGEHYLDKPFGPHALSEMVHTLLGQRSGRS